MPCISACHAVTPGSCTPIPARPQDTIQKQKDVLEQGHPDVSAVGPASQGPAQAGSRELPVSSSGAAVVGDGDGTVGGQAVLLDEPGLANVSHLYVDVVGEQLGFPGPADRWQTAEA